MGWLLFRRATQPITVPVCGNPAVGSPGRVSPGPTPLPNRSFFPHDRVYHSFFDELGMHRYLLVPFTHPSRRVRRGFSGFVRIQRGIGNGTKAVLRHCNPHHSRLRPAVTGQFIIGSIKHNYLKADPKPTRIRGMEHKNHQYSCKYRNKFLGGFGVRKRAPESRDIHQKTPPGVWPRTITSRDFLLMRKKADELFLLGS